MNVKNIAAALLLGLGVTAILVGIKAGGPLACALGAAVAALVVAADHFRYIDTERPSDFTRPSAVGLHPGTATLAGAFRDREITGHARARIIGTVQEYCQHRQLSAAEVEQLFGADFSAIRHGHKPLTPGRADSYMSVITHEGDNR